jgi:hypothetical protein
MNENRIDRRVSHDLKRLLEPLGSERLWISMIRQCPLNFHWLAVYFYRQVFQASPIRSVLQRFDKAGIIPLSKTGTMFRIFLVISPG